VLWPDPAREIRMTALQTVRGANFWARRPVTRMDVALGAYEEISSAAVPDFGERLRAALPGIIAHRCSIGTHGGFLTRLARGTYAGHIIEHVALELQSCIGHDVGYGKTRGTDVRGEYTVVFEHRHAGVGRRAAELALEIVQRAFAGTLESAASALAELERLVGVSDPPSTPRRVRCGITGGAGRWEARRELIAHGFGCPASIIDVTPASLLHTGLPYTRSDAAIILDTMPLDVPRRYREPGRARVLVSVLADAVPPDGVVVVPAREWDVQRRVRDAGCRVAVFATGDEVTVDDTHLAHAVARVRNGRIVLEGQGVVADGGELRRDAHPAAQVAAALAVFAQPPRDAATTP
jgi:cyanophycin synthetase